MTAVNKIISATAKEVAEDLARMGIRLDGSEASLKDLDDAIEMLWGEGRPAEEFLDGMVWGYGCYVADVIQRHHIGEWKPADDAGYDFIPANGAIVINPWHWVEKRFQFGDLLAPAYQSVTHMTKRDEMPEGKANPVSDTSSKTNISIQGMGVSIAFLEIDQESFQLVTQAGITEVDYQQLIDEVEDEGRHEEGLLADNLAVTIDDKVFNCSWEKIKPQLKNQCLLPQRPYERLNVGGYLIVYEKGFESRWEEIEVENYSHSKLKFNVECVEPSKGVNYLLMDFTFSSDALSYVSTYSESGDAYVVDRQGNRHAIKVAYEW